MKTKTTLATLFTLTTMGQEAIAPIEQPTKPIIPEETTTPIKVEKKEEKTPSLFEQYNIGAYIGHSFMGASYTIEGQDATFKGNSLRFGITKSVDLHKFRIGYERVSGEMDTLQLEGTNYNVGSLGVTLTYKVDGINLGYVYNATPNFAIGPYFKKLSGNTEGCNNNNGSTCATATLSVTEIGLRIEAKVKYWNPYIELGSSSIKEDTKSYDGASVYLGLLNLEF